MPPNPPRNAHGFAMRSMSLRDMQIPKSEKKNSWPPPLPNPGDAPDGQLVSVDFKDKHLGNCISSSINDYCHIIENTCDLYQRSRLLISQFRPLTDYT